MRNCGKATCKTFYARWLTSVNGEDTSSNLQDCVCVCVWVNRIQCQLLLTGDYTNYPDRQRMRDF